MCVLTPDKTTPTYILCRRKENRWQGGRKDCWCVASLSHAQLFLTPILLALDESDIRIMKTYVSILLCPASPANTFQGSRSLCTETQGRR